MIRVVGEGGFGVVYLARDAARGRLVAIKEYMPSSLARRDKDNRVRVLSELEAPLFKAGLASFLAEARMLSRFDHPALVRMHESWEQHGTAYTVMPYYEGVTLKEMRRTLAGVPDEALLRRLLETLLGAIDTLHSASVFHRDISPDNIVMQPDGVPVLLDFGAARQLIADRTQTVTSILNPSFAPIEQYSHSGELSQGPWTDLYSLGAVMYFMIVGHPPPPAATRALDDSFPLLSRLAHDGLLPISPGFCAAIDWCLEFRPQCRPQRVRDVLEALDGRRTPPPPTRQARVADAGVPAARPPGLWAKTFAMARSTTAAAKRTGTRPARRIALAVFAVGICGAAAAWRATTAGAEPRAATGLAAAVVVEAKAATPVADAKRTDDVKPPRAARRANAASVRPRPEQKEKAAATATMTARASCSDRSVFTRAYCLRTECAKPIFQSDPTCLELAASDRRREERAQQH